MEITNSGIRPPGQRVLLLSGTGDSITVQVVDRVVPLDPHLVLYVERRGPFEIVRRETWPGGRALLMLAAWPTRMA